MAHYGDIQPRTFRELCRGRNIEFGSLLKTLAKTECVLHLYHPLIGLESVQRPSDYGKSVWNVLHESGCSITVYAKDSAFSRQTLSSVINGTNDSRYFSYLSPILRNTLITDVTEEDLRIWLVKSYLPTKPRESALKKMLQILKQVFAYGMSKNLCVYNPAEYILFDDYVKGCNLQKKRPEEREFSEEECAALRRDALKHISNPRSVMRLFAMETGLRAGELSALLWSDVLEDFVHVHRQQVLEKKRTSAILRRSVHEG